MTLATHLVVGAAGARLFAGAGTPSLFTAFLIGWMSHYILDSITHWDYPLSAYSSSLENPLKTTLVRGKVLFFDFAKVILDAGAGLILVYFFIRDPGAVALFDPRIFLGALGAAFPDFIQFAYSFLKWKPLGLMQRFHHFMHAKTSFENRPAIGISIQVIAIVIIILLAR